MRVAALTPLFVHETPEDPTGDSARVSASSDSRNAQVGSKQADSPLQDALSEETKAGIRRLSRLLRQEADGDRTDEGENARDNESQKESHEASRESTRDSAKNGIVATAELRLVTTRLIYFPQKDRGLNVYKEALDLKMNGKRSGRVMDLTV